MAKKPKKVEKIPDDGPPWGPYPGSERFSDWDIEELVPLNPGDVVNTGEAEETEEKGGSQ